MVRIVGDWFGMLGFVLPSFDTPDPLAEQFPQHSTYVHCAANPITLTDPTGKELKPKGEEELQVIKILFQLKQEDS